MSEKIENDIKDKTIKFSNFLQLSLDDLSRDLNVQFDYINRSLRDNNSNGNVSHALRQIEHIKEKIHIIKIQIIENS